ncbi:MAG: flagellar filament capping protein FliD, partial [Oscillospiraceae bacterium]|nr:flagellar filament capping protein FliD [Oscillospiraceae bacterium]
DGITRSSNSFDVDGMTVKLGGTFGKFDNFESSNPSKFTMGLYQFDSTKGAYATDPAGNKVEDTAKLSVAESNAVTFTATSDSEKIVEAIKNMVKDFNEMANEIKDAYSTKPLYNSKGKRYEPLTEKDEEDMTESAIQKYTEKAKTGILFGDNNLSALYSELRTAISDLGLSEIGIKTEYSNGKTTLVLDETKLRDTLETNPQKVTDVFTRNTADGASTDGVMQSLKNTLDTYAKTTGSKGILVNLAGSVKSPASINNNAYYQKLMNMEEQISRWQDKLSDKIDYYTRQFTQLEKMISQMNSQSSSLMGLMGY